MVARGPLDILISLHLCLQPPIHCKVHRICLNFALSSSSLTITNVINLYYVLSILQSLLHSHIDTFLSNLPFLLIIFTGIKVVFSKVDLSVSTFCSANFNSSPLPVVFNKIVSIRDLVSWRQNEFPTLCLWTLPETFSLFYLKWITSTPLQCTVIG